MTENDYVHGYSPREDERLIDQAITLTELLHRDTAYPSGSNVLEAGCGIGAQTVTLAKNSPEANIISIDISEESLNSAKARLSETGLRNVTFCRSNIFNLPFCDNYFDHIFICFVLEHLPDPMKALSHLKAKLKKGGTITVIEGDHGSAYYYPESEDAQKTIQCLIDMQAKMGGNSLIGRQLFPLLTKMGFEKVNVSPRMVYADSSRPEMVEGFTKNTFIAMVEGVGNDAIEQNMIDQKTWEKGINDMYMTAEESGTFCYTFFKGTAVK